MRRLVSAVLVVAATSTTISIGAIAAPIKLNPQLDQAIKRLNSGARTGKGTVLVVVSAADQIPLSNGKLHKTGYFLRELTDPLKEVLLAGYDVEFATPDAKTPQVDANSLLLAWYAFPKVQDAKERLHEAIAIQKSIAYLNGGKAPLSLEAAALKMKTYSALLVPGGHGPMVDLRYDKSLGKILRSFHEAGKPMTLICHGPVALLSAGQEGSWPFAGYRVSVVSTADEKVLESNKFKKIIGPIEGRLIEYADQELEKAGAVLAVSPVAGTPSFAVDREVITAQNPAAATAVGKILVRAIEERFGTRAREQAVPGISAQISFSDLAKASRQELTELYAKGQGSGPIPLGDTVGMGLVFPGHSTLNYLSDYAWQGKIFRQSEEGVVLVNKIFGYTEVAGIDVAANVRVMPSLFDGQPTIQLDYKQSDLAIAHPIVDEIRRIAPHLYLGRVTYAGKDLGFFTLYFVD